LAAASVVDSAVSVAAGSAAVVAAEDLVGSGADAAAAAARAADGETVDGRRNRRKSGRVRRGRPLQEQHETRMNAD
jgi:hypothetical protein